MDDLSLKNRKKTFSKINKILKNLYPQIKIALNFSNPWELLVSTILSAQATDKKVNEITLDLFKKYKTIEDYARADLKEFERDISKINYYKTKAKNIIESAKIILEKFNGQVPQTMEEMLELKGVGRKTANVVLSNAFYKDYGIVVDTHVKRFALMYHLTNYSDPLKIEQDLMKIVPKKEWREFPLRLISYGRDYCPNRTHDHQNCPIEKALRKT
jgi:endonuclease-3